LALRVYVVVLVGNTWRVPLAETVPIPGAIDTSVASLTSHFRVADWPRSIELGSAEKLMLGAFGGAGGGVTTGFGGGGGGGGGAFFLHPAAIKNNDTATSTILIFLLLILNYASWGSGQLGLF
jgi:hypothetical protein